MTVARFIELSKASRSRGINESGQAEARFFIKNTIMTATLNKFYVTKEGLEKIQAEYEKLRDFKHQKTMDGTPNLLHSEEANPEYLAFQEDMSLLDARLAEYENILQNAELIVRPLRSKQNVVDLGARVTVEVAGQSDEFEIVGTLEANPSVGRISNESPGGRALLGRKVGDAIEISSPTTTVYRIKKIRYVAD